MKKAVVFCQNHDILKELLKKNASEVFNMLTAEWNLEDAKQVWFEDGMEKAIELFEQGLSADEIKQQLKSMRNDAHATAPRREAIIR